ncbi:MAG: hypothetical protein GY765_23770 [bacterium]|nr:hypothetical protein [bacterium]
MNINHLQKLSRFFILIFLFAILAAPITAGDKDTSRIKMSWQEFRQLLKLDSNDITLTWQEFKQLTAQTGKDNHISYSVKNGKIILPREQFRQLLNRMKPPVKDVPQPPGEYVISKAQYKGVMAKKSTAVTALFSMEIFAKKGTKYFQVPILPKSVGLAEVLLDGTPALVMEKNGWYHVTTTQNGLHQIKVKYFVASHLEKGPQILNLEIPKTAITLLELTIPMEKIDISVPDAKELTISPKQGAILVNAVIPAGNNIRVQAHRKYTPEKKASKSIPAKMYAETLNLISIEEDALRVTGRIKLNVLQNSITGIKVMVPEGYNILYVRKQDGTRIRGRQIKNTDKGPVVEIPFDSPVEGTFVFDILSEKLFEAEQSDIHFNGYRILDAVRETGYIGAEKKSTAEAAPTAADKLDRIDIKDLPYQLVRMSKRPLLFGYRYLRHPFNLTMSITKHEELPTISTIIDMAAVITVVLEDGKTLTRVNYKIRNTWKQFLKLQLPEGSEVWTVYVDSKRENASRNAGGQIMIPLARSRIEGEVLQSFTVDLIYLSKGDTMKSMGSNRVYFPTADIMISKMLWSVYLPQDYAYLHFTGNVEKEEIAGTMNLLLGNKRHFSLDQIDAYNEVAGNLEKEPQKQQIMDGYQQSLQSNFKNSAIGQRDIANQMRQEANLNLDFQKEQGKRLGQPGTGSNIFKIELPTGGQIYRFNKTIIEEEPITLSFYYTSNTIKILAKILMWLALLLVLFLSRKKFLKLFKRLVSWVKGRKRVWELLRSKTGLRTTLCIAALVFFFISHVLFVVLVLLFIVSVFRPGWLRVGEVKPVRNGENKKRNETDKQSTCVDTVKKKDKEEPGPNIADAGTTDENKSSGKPDEKPGDESETKASSESDTKTSGESDEK